MAVQYVGREFFEERAHEKQRARDEDARALADGTKTKEQLRHENGGFSSVKVRLRLDLSDPRSGLRPRGRK